MITKIGISGNLLIVSTHDNGVNKNDNLSLRSAIETFSASSARRMRRYLRDTCVDYTYMHTLTYPKEFPTNGIVFKDDLRQYCQSLKRYVAKNGTDEQVINFSVFWFMEFQNRGAVHYHLFTNYYFPTDFVSQKWYKIVDSNDEKHLKAGTRVESLRSGRAGTISYASKYANKQQQKNIPAFVKNAGRFWGIYGNRECVSAHTKVDSNTSEKVTNMMFSVLSRIEKLQNQQMLKNIYEQINHVGFFAEFQVNVGVWVYQIENKQAELELAREIAVLDRLNQYCNEIKVHNAFYLCRGETEWHEDEFECVLELYREGFI